MTYRIAVSSKIPDPRAQSRLHTLKTLFPQSALEGASFLQAYTIDAEMSPDELTWAAERLTNSVTENYSTKDVPAPEAFAYAIEVGYLPGVTDNVGRTAQETIEDRLGRTLGESAGVYSSFFLFLSGELSRDEAERMSRELYNPLIERASVYSSSDAKTEYPIIIPKVKLQAGPRRADEVNLEADDAELKKISAEGIANVDGTRRGPLALSLTAMKTIRDHFRREKRNPTDIELESLAQTWSEHCKHTIFADPLDEVEEGIYRRYIKGATEKIRKQKGKKDFCVSVFKDNSGAIAFDKDYLITHKVETHNAPSALDPFGGSVTAIVGVNRDCLGFGLGARPIANVYGFCVADPHDETALYRDVQKKQPLLSARRILEGVVRGVNAGGNQSGIPTPLGFVAVDPSFRGKPLVFGGTVGLIPRKLGNRKSYLKSARPGDYIVMIGGRVGLDGIHGATFSSEALAAGSPATAVQIGDPITQKKFSDALVREARDKSLYSSITDNGAGGLSGSVGEMAKESGGCRVDLEKVPLKYPGLSPWQIWLSESQERMTSAVPKKSWNALKKIFDRHDVEATRIGEFTNSKSCVVRYEGKTVMDMPLSFLHDGRPIVLQKSKAVERKNPEPSTSARNIPPEKALLQVLARPSVGSISFISQQYDHEVQGMSVTKPLQGKGRVNTDAAVLQPLPDSERGVVLSHGYAPWYSQIDTYAMTAAAIDTAVRNAICAGASRDYLAILDNFCWSSSEKPERLYELKRAAEACFDIATAYDTPFISGKDSMFNDYRGCTEKDEPTHIAALPTVLISAIGVITDVRKAMTIDWKQAGDPIYLLGETNDELGASEYFQMLGAVGNTVPRVDTKKNAKTYDTVSKAIKTGLIASAIGVGRGGLGIALAKSAIAGQLGANVDLKNIPGNAKSDDSILFSESQGRILVSVRSGCEKKFEKVCQGVALTRIGETGSPALSIDLPGAHVEASLPSLTDAYRSFFKNW